MGRKIIGKKKKRVVADASDSDDLAGALAKEFDIQVMSEDTEEQVPYRISFRHAGLQYITGGVPGGRFSEIIGDSASGKSYLGYELISRVLEMGGKALLQDVEVAYESKFGKRVGITGDKSFFYSKNKSLEKSFIIWRKFIKLVRQRDKDCPILIVVDSYPPLTPAISLKATEKMNEKEQKGYIYARKNAILGEKIGEFTTFLDEQKATLVMINQGRTKMNVMFGDTRTSNAENVLRFYATLRLWGKVGAKIKAGIGDTDKDRKITMRQVGVSASWETIKNRSIHPFKKTEARIIYTSGLQMYSGLFDLLAREGRIKLLPKKRFKFEGKVYPAKAMRKLVKRHPELLVVEKE